MFKKRLISLTLVFSLLFVVITEVSAEERIYASCGEVCDMLMVAAEGYTKGLNREDIFRGTETPESRQRLITRTECYVMISKAFGTLPEPKGNDLRGNPELAEFTDLPEWARSEINNLINGRVIDGSSDKKLRGSENITIDEVETIIKRIWSLKGSELRDDYYSTINKKWLDSSVIKTGDVASGGFNDISELNNRRLSKIIEDISENEHEYGTPEQKISDFYLTVLDMDLRNKESLEPIKPYLEAIDAAGNMKELYAVQKEMYLDLGHRSMFAFIIDVDIKNSNKYTVYFYVNSPMLSKEYYLDEESPTTIAYKNYLTSMLKYAGEENAAGKAESFFEMEAELSEKSLDSYDYNDIDKIYNKYTSKQLQKIFAEIDINELLMDTGELNPEYVVSYDTGLMKAFAKYYNKDNLELLKTTAKINLLYEFSGVLDQGLMDITNDFYSALYGTDGTKTSKENASLITQSIMEDYLGEIYVKKYFSKKAKADVEEMVEEFISIYKTRIMKLDWLSDVTKSKAIEKLDSMTVKIGYPDTFDTLMDWIQITGPDEGGSFFSNITAISRMYNIGNASLLGMPVDKSYWQMAAFEVNAYYNPSGNEIVFPAGILQAPFYDIKASRETNLGGIGVIIAHEITHAFDNIGSKYDKDGNAADWWTEDDYNKFEELCGDVVKHFDNYESAPGIYLDGKLTLGENIADLGGLACALDAMKKIADSDYKAFFENNALIWRITYTRQYMELLSKYDTHSSNKARVNKVLQNFEEFYGTYGITEDDGMYLAPEKRVGIW